MRTLIGAVLLILSFATPALAGDVQGRVTDRTGGVLPGAAVHLLKIATGQDVSTFTDANGRFTFTNLSPGEYRVAARFQGFSESSKTVIVPKDGSPVVVDFVLELGTLRTDVTVTAARGARDTQLIPLRADSLSGDTLRQTGATGTGDAMIAAPGVTLVGSGPFQTRPRLRGLDSTRVLVLVDGERLNNARTATDRAGIEVGLVSADTVDSIEVLGGAGSVLYGTDALSGTINIITNRPTFSDARQYKMGFDGLYSSNEHGRRGTISLGMSDRRWTVSFSGGGEQYDDFHAGKQFAESSVPYFTSGQLQQVDTIDTNFGFSFKAFPEAFNAPFTRTGSEIPQSAMRGTSANLAAVVKLSDTQELQVRYLGRHATDVGFPDFEQPYFFQRITLPWSRLDKFSASYSLLDVTPRLRKLTITSYFQRQDRLLRNDFPVQFPAPTAGSFFPISVFRLNITSDTRQQVWTPGLDIQGNYQLLPNNLLTTGLSLFRDRSRDERTTITGTTIVGDVDLGAFGPQANVYSSPLVLGPPATAHPVRVPNASFRDLGIFLQDEWDVRPEVRLTGGIRIDAYRVATDATPGYSVDSIVAGAVPAIDPGTLPNINGDRISRTAVTGEAGAVFWSSRPVSLFTHYVHSYRHPNLEELLFSGPATAGNIAPNVTVEPETGNNIDVGVKLRLSRLSGSIAYFHNRYDGFISTEVVANSPAGPISQAINLAQVRIQGLEAQADVPFVAAGLAWSPYGSLALTRGTVLSGSSPLSGVSLAGEPQDNISPIKFVAGLRVSDRSDRWWGAYNLRAQAKVTRVSPLLADSPYLIAQDLFGLQGFSVQRLAAGYNWRMGDQHVGFTLAIDNLTDRFYREQFQFAPARGRSVSLIVSIRGLR